MDFRSIIKRIFGFLNYEYKLPQFLQFIIEVIYVNLVVFFAFELLKGAFKSYHIHQLQTEYDDCWWNCDAKLNRKLRIYQQLIFNWLDNEVICNIVIGAFSSLFIRYRKK